MRRKVVMFLILMYRVRQSRSRALSSQNTAFILHCYALTIALFSAGAAGSLLLHTLHFPYGVCLLFPSPW